MSNTLRLRNRVDGPRAWQRNTVGAPDAWHYALPDHCLSLLDDTVQRLRREPRRAVEIRAENYPSAACREDLLPALDALESGRGFVVIDGMPIERYSIEEAQAVYWVVGQLIGRPFEQNVQGTLLYDGSLTWFVRHCRRERRACGLPCCTLC